MSTLTGYKIWVDAGHGGNPPSLSCDTFGTSGQLSGPEKSVNLDVALRLRSLLQNYGATVQMTRVDDRVVCLADRVAASNNWGSHIFVSIHHNGYSDPTVRGTETYYYREGLEKEMATCVHDYLVSRLGRVNRGLKYGNYMVLRETNAWSVLTEAVFQTNSSDDQFIASASNRQKQAQAIADAIACFVSTLPPIQ